MQTTKVVFPSCASYTWEIPCPSVYCTTLQNTTKTAKILVLHELFCPEGIQPTLWSPTILMLLNKINTTTKTQLHKALQYQQDDFVKCINFHIEEYQEANSQDKSQTGIFH